MIGMFDSNGDGAINFNEFQARSSCFSPPFQALWQYINDWTNCFRGFDLDNSGNIDKQELQNALSRFGKLSYAAFQYDGRGGEGCWEN
ncbi:EF hand [Cooperia oncophora]